MSTSPFRIERLGSEHDRSAFASGAEPLDTYLRQFSLQNDRKGVGRTFVVVRAGMAAVVGFYTLSAGSVRAEVLPPAAAKKLPRYPVPVAHLARLAVDRSTQGQGLGAALLVDAFRRVLLASDVMAVHAVEVVAKDDGARRFYERYGFISLQDDPLHLYLPLATIRKALGADG